MSNGTQLGIGGRQLPVGFGTGTSGTHSLEWGASDTTASGDYATAWGANTKAGGNRSTAWGIPENVLSIRVVPVVVRG